MSAPVNGSIRLRNEKVLFAVGSEIINLVRHATLFHFAVRGLDKTKLVDARERTHRADQTNVRTFRRLDRANPTVMRWMAVAHLNAVTFAAQTSGPERGQTAFMRQLGKRIRLIHEL